jgi:predicted small secreted protein
MIRTLLLTFLVVAVALGLSACTNTVRGVGTDLEKAGQEIQKSAR